MAQASKLDSANAALMAGGEAEGLAFYHLLADADLFLLLEVEAEGEVMTPRVFDLAAGPVLLVFDSEERLAAFAQGPQPYAALPGRVICGQMRGQGLSLGLNLGSGAASETILPPDAIDWLMEMLDQKPAEAVTAQVAEFEAPQVPDAVLAALAEALAGIGRALLLGARYRDGRRGQLLVVTGVAPEGEAKVARAVIEALAFSGIGAGALDVAFLTADDPALPRMAGLALILQGAAPALPEAVAPLAPGLDKERPPILRQTGVI